MTTALDGGELLLELCPVVVAFSLHHSIERHVEPLHGVREGGCVVVEIFVEWCEALQWVVRAGFGGCQRLPTGIGARLTRTAGESERQSGSDRCCRCHLPLGCVSHDAP